MVDCEDLFMRTLRHAGHPLLNKNRAKSQSNRREYMRQWRIRNGQGTGNSYMARKSREHRAHREQARVAALAAKAEELALEMEAEEVESAE